MNFTKKILTSFFAGLLSITLFGMAWANIGLKTIHDRQVVKGWFEKSNFYNQVVDVVLEQAKDSANKNNQVQSGQEQKNEGISSLPINDPAIQAIAKKAFSPELLKASVESFLNGSYDWLDGTSEDINFRVDLTSAKQQLTDGLGAYITNRTAALPVCPPAQTTEFDGFSATCRPAALSATAAGANFSADLLKQDFLKDPIITSDKLKIKGDDGREVELSNDPKAEAIKTTYQRSSQLPWILAGLSLLLALGIVFISSDKLKGLRKASYVFFITGTILLLIFVSLSFGLTRGTDRLAETGAESPQQTKLMIDFAKAVVSDIKGALVTFTAAFLLIGIAGLIGAYLLKKRTNPTDKKEDEKPAQENIASEDTTEEKKPEETLKPVEKTEDKKD